MSSYYLSDQPLDPALKPEVFFQFEEKARAKAQELIAQKGPFIVGVHGAWGSGKTTFCNYLASNLEENGLVVVRYNAWRYENDDYPVIPLLSHLVADDNVKNFFKESYGALKDLLSGIKLNISANNILVGKAGATFAFDKMLEGKHLKEAQSGNQKKDLEDFFQENASFSSHLDKLRKSMQKEEKTLFILIDDMDRCNPEKAVALLEQIKLVLDLPSTIFVLALNEKTLDGFIRKRYELHGIEDFTINEYIEKLIQLRYYIAPITPDEMAIFAREGLKLYPNIPEEAYEFTQNVVVKGAAGNPRSAIRIINQIAAGLANDTSKTKITVLDEAIRVAAPDLRQEIRDSKLSRDYIRSIVDNEEWEALEDFIIKLVPRSRLNAIMALFREWSDLLTNEELTGDQQKSLLFKKEHLNSPAGHKMVLDLARFYGDKLMEPNQKTIKNSLAGLTQIMEQLRKFGDYSALSSFCLSMLDYVKRKLTVFETRTQRPVTIINPTFQHSAVKNDACDLAHACLKLCSGFCEVLPIGMEHLKFKLDEYLFEVWSLRLSSKPDEFPLNQQQKIFFDYMQVFGLYLRSELRHSGEVFSFGKRLLDYLESILRERPERLERNERLEISRKLELLNIFGNQRSRFIKTLQKLDPNVLSEDDETILHWLRSLLKDEDPALFGKKVDQERLRLVNKLGEEVGIRVDKHHKIYLTRVLKALADSNNELAVIYEFNMPNEESSEP